MKISRGKQLQQTLANPFIFGDSLTLGAMAIATGVIGLIDMATTGIVTLPDMPSQNLGSTG